MLGRVRFWHKRGRRGWRSCGQRQPEQNPGGLLDARVFGDDVLAVIEQ
jgi:hypothetical protein